jgi:hypothetical protein
MNPYLRSLDSDTPLPDGWTTEPARQWNGHEIEIAYHPARHDFMLVRGTDGDDIEGRLDRSGTSSSHRRPDLALVPRPPNRRPRRAGPNTRRSGTREQEPRPLTTQPR